MVEMFGSFDGFIAFAKEKLLKPDVAIYECLFNRCGLHSDECLYIDDLQVNIDGSEKVGFHGHLFQGSQELLDYLGAHQIL